MIESHIKSLATIEIEELDMFAIQKAELAEQFGGEDYPDPPLFEDDIPSPDYPIETDPDAHMDALLFE
jgi:hypothetical protein